MPTDMTAQKNADVEFFERVKTEPKFVETLRRLRFEAPWVYNSLGNAGLGVSKPGWTIFVPAADYSLNVHFEARKRTEYRIEVGPEPYISNLAKKPDLLVRLAPLVVRRAEIIDILRRQLLKPGLMPQGINASKAHQLRSTTAAAHTIVTFETSMPADPSPTQSAAFFSRVIEAVTPTVDYVLGVK